MAVPAPAGSISFIHVVIVVNAIMRLPQRLRSGFSKSRVATHSSGRLETVVKGQASDGFVVSRVLLHDGAGIDVPKTRVAIRGTRD